MRKIIALFLTAILSLGAVALVAAYEPPPDLGNIRFDVQKAATDIKLDGKISEGEGYKIDIQPGWMSYGTGNDAELLDIAKRLPFELYMSWNDTGLYIGTVVTYEKFVNEASATMGDPLWRSCYMQYGLSEADSTGNLCLEIGIGMNSSGEQYAFRWVDYASSGVDPVEGEDFKISNDGLTYTYEYFAPFDYFTFDTIKEGSTVGVCIVWGSGYGTDETYIHTQLAAGVSNGKDAGNFAQVTLVAAKPAETAPPETEAPETQAPETAAVETPSAQTQAPATYDALIITVLAAVAASGAAIIVKKK